MKKQDGQTQTDKQTKNQECQTDISLTSKNFAEFLHTPENVVKVYRRHKFSELFINKARSLNIVGLANKDIEDFILGLVKQVQLDGVNESVLKTQEGLKQMPIMNDYYKNFQNFLTNDIRNYLMVLITDCVDSVQNFNRIHAQMMDNVNQILVYKNSFLRYKKTIKDTLEERDR